MENNYLTILSQFGIKSQEAQIYLACLKLGQGTVSEIAHESGVQRTFIYDLVKNMVNNGLLSEVEIRNTLHYSAISIDKFKILQEEKINRLESIIPEIKASVKTIGDKPRVQFFEGTQGIQIALEDTLKQPQNGTILAFATAQGYYSQDQSFINSYLRRRIKKGITVKAIGPDLDINREFVKHDQEQLRETRLVDPKLYPFTNEIDIYENKVAIMSLQGELMSVIIESESVAKTLRSIFELAWKGATQRALPGGPGK